jgi:hypothetical protein
MGWATGPCSVMLAGMQKICLPLALLGLILPIAGCGGGTGSTPTPTSPTTPTTPSAPTYPSLTGNWGITAASTATVGASFPVGVYLTSSQSSVSGIAHLVSSCYWVTVNVPLTGTVDTGGNLALMSTSVNGQVLSVNAKISGTTIASGTYSVAGGCAAGDKGTLSGGVVAGVNGTYAGTVKSVSGLSIQVSAQLAQTSMPDANGFLHLSGKATFTGSPCFTQTTIATPAIDSDSLGLYYVADFTAPSPSTAVVGTAGYVSADGKTITLEYGVKGGGVCNGDTGTGTLTLQ